MCMLLPNSQLGLVAGYGPLGFSHFGCPGLRVLSKYCTNTCNLNQFRGAEMEQNLRSGQVFFLRFDC